jgi:putative oxidoreductase
MDMRITPYTNSFRSGLRRADVFLTQGLARYSVTLLRVSLGLIFLSFGVLKFFPGLSPTEDLAGRTAEILTFGLVPKRVGLVGVATLETALGLCLTTGRWLGVGFLLLELAVIGILSTIILLPGELFRGFYIPTLEGQYVLLDVVLLSAGLVIAAKARGARMIVERRQPASVPGSGSIPDRPRPLAGGLLRRRDGAEAGGLGK